MRDFFISYLKQYRSLLIFLSLEFLFITAFNLGNLSIILRTLSIVLALALTPFALIKNKNDDWLDMTLMLLPLALFMVFFGLSDIFTFLYEPIEMVLIIFSVIAFFMIGYNLRRAKLFNMHRALPWLMGGLGLLLFIGLSVTLFQYTPFYVLRFFNQVIYVDGEVYTVSNEAMFLFGFELYVVSTMYVALFAVVLTSLLFGFLDTSMKQFRLAEWILLGSGMVGLATIIFLPLLQYAWLILPALIVVLWTKYGGWLNQFRHQFPRIQWSIYGVIGLGVLVFVLFSFQIEPIYTLLRTLPFISRVFTHPFILRYASVIQASVNYPFGGAVLIFVGNSIFSATNNSFIDALHFGGIFSAIGWALFIYFTYLSLVRYHHESKDPIHIKRMIYSFLITYFVFTLFFYPNQPFIRENEENIRIPFASDWLLLLNVFLVGYTFTTPFSNAKSVLALDDELSPASLR